MKKIFLLDFDGVICNSFKECIYVAYSSINKKINYKKFSLFFRKYKNILEFYNAQALKGVDYCKIIKIYKYNKFKKKININKFKLSNNYNELFYSYRKKIIKLDFNLWLRLNPIFPQVKKILKKKNIGDIRILSNKDFSSIDLILNHNSIKIDKDKIMSKEKFKNKNNYIKNLLKKKNYKVIFVDDHIENLYNLKLKNIDKYLLCRNNKIDKSVENRAKKNKINKIQLNKIKKIFE